jgi:hypothetical protein
MSKELDRRRILQASLGLAALVGVGAEVVLDSAAASAHDPGTDLPPVPGMLGDRYANEFWNEFDNTTLFNQAPEVTNAFIEIESYFATSDPPPRALWVRFNEYVGSPDYPANFIAFMEPIKGPLKVLSAAQASVFDRFYHRRDPRLIAAFSHFAQGVLFDPRHRPPVHTMGSNPPVGYHVWHIFMRAMMFLNIDRRRWRRLAPLNGFAWAVQSLARPSQQVVNPGLPHDTVRQLERTWLHRDMDELDTAFLSFPFPA